MSLWSSVYSVVIQKTIKGSFLQSPTKSSFIHFSEGLQSRNTSPAPRCSNELKHNGQRNYVFFRCFLCFVVLHFFSHCVRRMVLRGQGGPMLQNFGGFATRFASKLYEGRSKQIDLVQKP